MGRFSDRIRRLRLARIHASLREDPDPNEMAALATLTREKQLAVVGMLSAYVQIRSDTSEEQALSMIADFIPDVNDRSSMGAAAVQNAQTNVIFHLLRELARERGEPVEQVWQQAAAELTRHASGE